MDGNELFYLKQIIRDAVEDRLDRESFRPLCEYLHIGCLFYDMDLGGENRYRDRRNGNLIMAPEERDDKIILFDNGKKTDLCLTYAYHYNGYEYVHASVAFELGVKEESLDADMIRKLADLTYLLVSRKNMRIMLDFAEQTDTLTGIPNLMAIQKHYEDMVDEIPPEELVILRTNLQNFKYINEEIGSRGGDEAIIQYSGKVLRMLEEDEIVARMGGDNFVFLIYKKNLEKTLKKLSLVEISNLKTAPQRAFEVSSWIGVSIAKPGERKPFHVRMNDGSVACQMGKERYKRSVVYFEDQLNEVVSKRHEIIAAFRPAIRNREFFPYFQPKVDMRSGKLMGFEALCRWKHNGQMIYPDQFIPVLDKEGLISDLDMEIFRASCETIKKWKDMGLNPPRVSSNFSRKNLFVQNIEDRILETVNEYGLSPDDLEVEITESVNEGETDRLMQFVRKLKENGFHISIDDFGTGYSSLSMIHNIKADVLKIDKSFVDHFLESDRSGVLLESIVSIAQRLDMETIAEGVENSDQGIALMKLGCNFAQGYYYSKPVDYDAATKMLQEDCFKAIGG